MRPLTLIVAGHFLASFSVLGMAPYFAIILERSYGQTDARWAGVLYVLPLVMMAVAGPFWGLFADRFGKRLSLARAQMGLALALLLCAYAPNALTFGLCLVLQGILGGTFSASNTLLSDYYRGSELARALSYLQYSARLSLFLAPTLLGLLIFRLSDPQDAYRWLWLLPVLGFAVLQLLPAPTGQPRDLRPTTGEQRRHQVPFPAVLAVEFVFTLMTVVTFPYFVKFFNALPTGLPEGLAGLYFGTPHVVYLMLAFLVIRRANSDRALGSIALAFALFSVSMLGHLVWTDPVLLWLARTLMGVSLVLGYVYLNQLVSEAIRPAAAGRSFGWLDTAGKFAGVIAGLLASLLVGAWGLSGPFVLAALMGAVFAGLTLVLRSR